MTMEPTDIVIRPERAGDESAIERVTVAAFSCAPHAAGTEHLIVAALRAAGVLTVSLVAEIEDRIVGHVAVSPVTIGEVARGWFGLGPISVEPERQGRGIGSGLMRAALAELGRKGASGCVLVGEPAYYERFGFRSSPGLSYPGVPAQYLLALPFDVAVPGGVVTFHPAFGVQA
jgi:predicted N-acetyltransferase YhbS